MEIELLGYLKRINTIKGLELEDLKGLFNSPTKSYKNLTIKIEAQDSIIVYNKTTRKNIRLDCVCNNFNLTNKVCMKIKDELDIGSSSPCRICYKECLRKHANGKLNKK